jgi:hypothetical protein
MKRLAHLAATALMFWGLVLPPVLNNKPDPGWHRRGWCIIEWFSSEDACEKRRTREARYWRNIAARGNPAEEFWSAEFDASACRPIHKTIDAGMQPQPGEQPQS